MDRRSRNVRSCSHFYVIHVGDTRLEGVLLGQLVILNRKYKVLFNETRFLWAHQKGGGELLGWGLLAWTGRKILLSQIKEKYDHNSLVI